MGLSPHDSVVTVVTFKNAVVTIVTFNSPILHVSYTVFADAENTLKHWHIGGQKL
jgi:hypothetical protein